MRNNSKIALLPWRRVTALCILVVITGCGTSPFPQTLQPGEISAPIPFELTTDAEVVLHLTMQSDTDWLLPGREAAVVTLFLDGDTLDRNQDVVLFAGNRSFTYRLLLGPLAAGRHTLSLRFNRELSSPKAGTVSIQKAEFIPISPDHADYDIYRFSPLLYGRDDNATTDTPLLMYHQVFLDRGVKTIEYTVIWSNEDGGTNSIGLMSRWGRTTDIELIYRIRVDNEGNILREEYHGAGHDTLTFRGKKIGWHPILRTATLNNVVSDSGVSKFKFFFSPERRKDREFSREIIMDQEPWTYEIMAKEMQREKKYEEPADPGTVEVSDARNYLYIEFYSEVEGRDPRVVFGVRLKNSSKWFYSDHGLDTVQAVNKSGWRRTTIELPQNFRLQALDSLAILGDARGPFRIIVKNVSKLFKLSWNFAIETLPIVWSDEVELNRRNPRRVIAIQDLKSEVTQP